MMNMSNIAYFGRVLLKDTHKVSTGTRDKDNALIALEDGPPADRLGGGRGKQVAFAFASAKPKGRYAAYRLMMLAAGAMALGLIPSQQAAAGALLTNFRSASTAINAGALTVNGTYQFDQFSQADPWVAQLFAEAGDCFRIDVFSEDTDLKAVLISPNGTFWSNDDRNGATDRRPLIKALGTGKGWHVLQIARFDGQGPSANFKFAYGRYAAGNPNCANPTPSQFIATSAKAP